MTRQHRLGFTLVEMLVVIVIISILVGLLVPAVNSAREKARRTQCLNNQREVSLGILQYENTIGRFPGWINRLGTNPVTATDTRIALTWPTVILPHVGREDVWKKCRELDKNNYATNVSQATVRMAQYVCPSAGRTETTALSYVANGGIKDLTPAQVTAAGVSTPDGPTTGLFHNRYNYGEPSVSASRIKDGASHTLMLSENLQAGEWLLPASWISSGWPTNYEADNGYEAHLVMVFEWLDYVQQRNQGPPPKPPTLKSPPLPLSNNCAQINRGKEDPRPDTRPLAYTYARPSSNHPGGVVVSYCDGRAGFLSENIQYLTYQHLVAPDSDHAAPINTIYDPAERPLLPPLNDPEYTSE